MLVIIPRFGFPPREKKLPETNIASENGWLEYYFPIGEAYFQGLLLLVSGRVDLWDWHLETLQVYYLPVLRKQFQAPQNTRFDGRFQRHIHGYKPNKKNT